MSIKIGEYNNCEKCGASYSTYNLDTQSDWAEEWCETPIDGKEPKGVCQFCNPKSAYYNK